MSGPSSPPAEPRGNRRRQPALVREVEAWRDRRLAEASHGPRTAAVLGIALGVSFTVCFVTGVLSHLIQHPPAWFEWSPRPAGLYRVTQSVHVATGLAAIPLLLAKLWSVFPRLLRTPVVRDVAHGLERVSLLPLVGGSLFLLLSGVANIDLWYPWPFFFPAGHYWVAWITMGALVVHLGAKWAVTRSALSPPPPRRSEARVAGDAEPLEVDPMSRRRLLAWAGMASATLTLATVGQTVSPLRRLALLAPRRPDRGVQGFPVNKTAIEAGVVPAASSPGYRLSVEGAVATPLHLSLEDLHSFPARAAVLPIACVEGWSASRRWTGVALRDVLARAGAGRGHEVSIVSLQAPGLYTTSAVNPQQLDDPDTLLAYAVDGEPLALDHGFPLRLIGPNRPGVQQTKWVSRVVVR